MSKTLIRLTITQSVLFSSWPTECIDRLVESADTFVAESGTCVHRAGDPAEFLYLLVAGAMSLTRELSPKFSFSGGLHLPGAFHGLGPVITQRPHIHTAVCKDRSVFVRISGQVLRDVLVKDARLFFPIFAALESRHLRALDLYASAVMYSTQARIAGLLTSIYACSSRTPSSLQVNLSQNEIASMLGTRRQVVNRALKGMEANGVIRVEYGRIIILDFEKLELMSRDDESELGSHYSQQD